MVNPVSFLVAPYPWQQRTLEKWHALLATRTGHAYALIGSPGWGKRRFASMMLREALCADKLGEAWFDAGTHPDFRCMSGGGIDEVRAILEFAQQTAHRKKGILIERADTLSISAQNALLKTLEEPSGEALWVLVIEDPSLVLPTILSRCQRLSLEPCQREQGLAWMAEQSPESTPLAIEQAWALGRGSPLLAKDCLAKAAIWQRWVEGWLQKAPWPELKAEQVSDYFVLWQQLLWDLSKIHLKQFDAIAFKLALEPLKQRASMMSLQAISEWNVGLYHYQRKITQSHINLKWTLQYLHQSWENNESIW